MNDLNELLSKLEYSVVLGKTDGVTVSDIVMDTRKLKEDCLFVCISGANFDGHSFAEEAISKGARVLVTEKDVSISDQAKAGKDPIIIRVDNTRKALAYIAAAYYDHPAEKLTTIGVTGTKGKTTTTYLIKEMLENAGHKVGLVGTIETVINDKHIPALNTTPESLILQKYFFDMVEAGIDAVVMEVSSQALMLHRTDGFIFDYGVFTNISPDHIGANEHKDFEDYMHCKSLLFSQCKTGIVNGDDAHVKDILKNATCSTESFGLGEGNDTRAYDITLINGGSYLGIGFKTRGLIEESFKCDMPGRFTAYNALCAISVCRHMGVTAEQMNNALRTAKVKGRIEMIEVSPDYTLMIDYAHNAMALESLLTTLKEYEPGRLVTVFGCGGNRSRDRRFEMGEVSGRLSDFTIITSDNPRFEEPQAILDDIETGIKKTDGEYIKIIDRKEAIAYAMDNAKKGDVVILAGKGHEDYQEIEGKKYPMDERVLIREILESRS
ncbi:MAG: UDP-N-acetylmuramoyl-L-alanyl-D-glutamate--2,6-diaminopimelate ligase [Lachnospiraceae bacterium]|nr:UDP-N-acetylmuramoyl-L-alanyl-D-glutamate--2,6-diaminopimelate ligase [Lachnospiraceae bacterium]